MTPIDLSLEKPTLHSQVWLTGYCYPQNIQRTRAATVNDLRVSAGRRCHCGPIRRSRRRWIRRPVSRVLCRRSRSPDIGDHSSGPPLAGRFSRPTRTARAYDSPTPIAESARSLFGLAPGGACHAVPVTRHAVGSYPTLSPFPLRRGRFAFCGAIPGVAPGGRYPPPCRRGARTFLDPLAEAATAQPSDPRGT